MALRKVFQPLAALVLLSTTQVQKMGEKYVWMSPRLGMSTFWVGFKREYPSGTKFIRNWIIPLPINRIEKLSIRFWLNRIRIIVLSYEEELKIRIWKTTLQYFNFFLSTFLVGRLKASCMLKISLLACLILDIAMKKTFKLGFGRRP